MPELKQPLIAQDLFEKRGVIHHLWVHLFIVKGASEAEVQLVRDSVTAARRILQKYDFGLSVVPAGGWDDEQIGTFSFSGPLFIDGLDPFGRYLANQQGAVQARGEVESKITFKVNSKIKPAVVLFGRSTSTQVRGTTNESVRYPWFCSVGLTQAAKTTMLHEVGHCASLQHYMANADLTDPATQDSKNIMAEVSDQKADFRDRLTQQELNLFKAGYFYNPI